MTNTILQGTVQGVKRVLQKKRCDDNVVKDCIELGWCESMKNIKEREQWRLIIMIFCAMPHATMMAYTAKCDYRTIKRTNHI